MMKRIIALIILAMTCLMIFASCTKSIDYGTVIDKSFEPAHQEIRRRVVLINKRTQVRHRWTTVPDTWKIRVQNEEGDSWWIVTEDYYNSVNVGDYVDRRPENDI